MSPGTQSDAAADLRPDPRETIEAALARLPDGLGPLQVRRALEKSLPGELARRAAELCELRRRARGRLAGAERLWLTGKGLEQATRSTVAAVRARAIAERFPGEWVLDATCGVGGDSVALAEAGLRVVSADRDPELAACAAWNLAALGHPPRVIRAEAARPAARAAVLVLDPDRRADGRRTLDPRAWSPALPEAIAAARAFRGACLKLAPAFRPEDWRPAVAGRNHRWQWVSAGGELLETSLWLGELADDASGRHEALLLSPGGGTERFEGAPVEVRPLDPDQARRAAWIAEPDPALVGSRLLGLLARENGLAPLGPRLSLLGGPLPAASPFLDCRRVLECSSADEKIVRAMLSRHGVGPVRVLRHGHALSTAELERRMRGKGERRGLLAVARLEQGHAAWLLASDDPGA